VAEELAIVETAQRRMALEVEIREAAEAAETEKERIREEAHKFLESERSKLREEQEALRAEILAASVVNEELAAAHMKLKTADSEERRIEADNLKALYSELATLRNQKRQSDLETAQLREEAKNILEAERKKRKDDEERLRAEMASLVTQVSILYGHMCLYVNIHIDASINIYGHVIFFF
jgi:ElaB/YqjD/DUF883 family membrane-anchored ribosome-binding protein